MLVEPGSLFSTLGQCCYRVAECACIDYRGGYTARTPPLCAGEGRTRAQSPRNGALAHNRRNPGRIPFSGKDAGTLHLNHRNSFASSPVLPLLDCIAAHAGLQLPMRVCVCGVTDDIENCGVR